MYVDLAKTPAEIKEDQKSYAMPAGPIAPKVPLYPYGLCITLDDDTLAKLGLDGDSPDVGDGFEFRAEARVTSASANEYEQADGSKKACRRVELQICRMDILNRSDEEEATERRGRWYGANADKGRQTAIKAPPAGEPGESS